MLHRRAALSLVAGAASFAGGLGGTLAPRGGERSAAAAARRTAGGGRLLRRPARSPRRLDARRDRGGPHPGRGGRHRPRRQARLPRGLRLPRPRGARADEVDAVFRIASMTKPFASLALMMLIEEGRVMLWHPVSRYIPEFKDAKVGHERAPAQREMTVLDLLRHTSGLTYGALPVAGGASAHPVQDRLCGSEGVRPGPDGGELHRPSLRAALDVPARHALGVQPRDRRGRPHRRGRVRPGSRPLHPASGSRRRSASRTPASGRRRRQRTAPPARRWTPRPAGSRRCPTRCRSRAGSPAAAAWCPPPATTPASARCC